MQKRVSVLCLLSLLWEFREAAWMNDKTRLWVQLLSATTGYVTLSQSPNLSGFPRFQSEDKDVPSTSDEVMYVENL